MNNGYFERTVWRLIRKWNERKNRKSYRPHFHSSSDMLYAIFSVIFPSIKWMSIAYKCNLN